MLADELMGLTRNYKNSPLTAPISGSRFIHNINSEVKTMDLKERLQSLIKLAYKEERTLIVVLDNKERTATGKINRWSVKDIIAHIAYWKDCTVNNILATLREENPDVRGDFNKINAEIFKLNKKKSWNNITLDLKRVHDSAVECVKTIPDDVLVDVNTLPWQEGKTLWRIIAGTFYVHPIAHLAEYYFDRGDSNYAVKLYEQSAALARELSDSPEWLGVVIYNLACGYALSNRHKRAIGELSKALKLNPDLIEWSKKDSDLDSIRKYKEYKLMY
jgi:tetratricopeptide (TPR) repeat protein